MLPKPGPKVQTFPPLRLYREDLETLVSLFQNQCKSLAISDETYTYASLDEMAERAPERLRTFHLIGLMPHIELVIRGSVSVPLGVQRSTLWIMEQNKDATLLFLSAKDILLGRQWKLRRLFEDFAVLFGILLTVTSILLKSFIATRFKLAEFTTGICGLAGIALMIAGAYFHSRQASFITLKLRSKADSFWKRNRDKIILILVTAAATEFIHWIVTRLTK